MSGRKPICRRAWFWLAIAAVLAISLLRAFATGGFGLAPSSSYHGVYYSADGEPAAFQNTDVPLGPSREGWIWHGEGDNYGETRHISGNWYTFYASF